MNQEDAHAEYTKQAFNTPEKGRRCDHQGHKEKQDASTGWV